MATELRIGESGPPGGWPRSFAAGRASPLEASIQRLDRDGTELDGVAVAGDIATAYVRANACDPVSAYGGIVAVNRPLSAAAAAAPA